MIIDGTVQGKFRLKITRQDNTVEYTPWSKNMLLNAGLTAHSFALRFCIVGTSSTPVSPTDTALGARLGTAVSAEGVGADTSLQHEYIGSVYKCTRTTLYSFGPGAVVGNVSEIAIYGHTTLSAATIRVRALVLDANGVPTTITVTAGDQLAVEHSLTCTVDTRPPPFNLVINGNTYSVQPVICFLRQSFGLNYNELNTSTVVEINAALNSGSVSGSISVPAVGVNAGGTDSNSVRITPTSVITADIPSRSFALTLTTVIPPSTQLPGNVAIGGVGFGHGSYSPISNRVCFLFTPSLPKSAAVGYSFAVTVRWTVS